MQVSPSTSLFQALSSFFQPQPMRLQSADLVERPAPAPAAPATGANAGPAEHDFEMPAPGTPVRRGMLLNILA